MDLYKTMLNQMPEGSKEKADFEAYLEDTHYRHIRNVIKRYENRKQKFKRATQDRHLKVKRGY